MATTRTCWTVSEALTAQSKAIREFLARGGAKKLPPEAKKLLHDAQINGRAITHDLVTRIAFSVLRETIGMEET